MNDVRRQKTGQWLFIMGLIFINLKYYLIWASWPDRALELSSYLHLNFLIFILFGTKILFFQKYNIKEMVLIGVVLFVFFMTYLSVGNSIIWEFLYEFILIFAAKDIDICKIAKVHIGSIVLILLMCTILNFISTGAFFTYHGGDDGRDNLISLCGLNPNGPAILMFLAYSVFLFINQFKRIWKSLIILIVFAVCNEIFFSCRTANICMIWMFVLFAIAGVLLKRGKEDLLRKLTLAVLILSILFNIAMFVLCYIDATNNIPFGHILDALSGDRLYYCNIEIQYNSPWTLFGQFYDGSNHAHITEYCGLDIGILYYLMKYGVVGLILYYGAVIYAGFMMVKEKYYHIALIISVHLLYAAYESEAIGFRFFPYIAIVVYILGNRKNMRRNLMGVYD